MIWSAVTGAPGAACSTPSTSLRSLGTQALWRLGLERAAQRAPLVAAADEPGGAGRGVPGRHEGGPAAGEVVGEPVVGVEGRGVGGGVVAVVDHEPGHGGELDHEGRRALVDLETQPETAQVADSETPRAQRCCGGLLPEGDEVGDEARDLLRRAGRLGLDGRGVEGRRWQLGRCAQTAVSASLAQGEGDLARQQDMVRVGLADEAVLEQPAGRGGGRAVGRARHPAHGRAPGEGREDRARTGGRRGEGLVHLRGDGEGPVGLRCGARAGGGAGARAGGCGGAAAGGGAGA